METRHRSTLQELGLSGLRQPRWERSSCRSRRTQPLVRPLHPYGTPCAGRLRSRHRWGVAVAGRQSLSDPIFELVGYPLGLEGVIGNPVESGGSTQVQTCGMQYAFRPCFALLIGPADIWSTGPLRVSRFKRRSIVARGCQAGATLHQHRKGGRASVHAGGFHPE
jgi:hypothetical protein